MYTGNVWFAALTIAGFLAALIALQLLFAAVLPAWAERSGAALRRRTLASFLIGAATLGVAALLLKLSGVLGGPGKFLIALTIVALVFPLVMGLAAVSRVVGERMPSPADLGRPWRATLRGGATCALAFVFPLVGWFIVLPAAMAAAFGAAFIGLFSAAPRPVAAPPTLPREEPAEAAA